jgi:aspartyl-tRNA(Asn)/glutamyl-tRNA(Gln) amidotransferase subunit C
MSVSIDEVKHVAMLARLGLTEERAQALTRDMNTILEHMGALEKVKTDGVREFVSGDEAGMRLRRDEGPAAPLSAQPQAFAPEMREGLFIVPRLATHEDTESA